jgi:hypothetical protein
MITTENSTTKVLFGNAEKANIAVRANRGTLTLQMLAVEKQIGDELETLKDGESLKEGDTQDLPKVEIEFQNVKSVEVLIAALQVIIKNYNPPVDFLAEAC